MDLKDHGAWLHRLAAYQRLFKYRLLLHKVEEIIISGHLIYSLSNVGLPNEIRDIMSPLF